MQTHQGIRLVSLHDIGAMKLHAIFQNGTRIKDFVDMYFLLEHHPLKTYLDVYQNKYNGNPVLASHSLLHHENIDHEEKVKLMKGKETNWNKMTQRLKKAVFNPSFNFSEPKNQIPPPKKDVDLEGKNLNKNHNNRIFTLWQQLKKITEFLIWIGSFSGISI